MKLNDIVREVIEDINLQLDSTKALSFDKMQKLVGEGSSLDSLGLLGFVTALEEKLFDSGVSIDLMDLLMNSENEKIFETIGTLTEFLETKKG